MSDKIRARLTVRGANKLSKRERKELREWLKDTENFIKRHGNNLSKTFRATLYNAS